MLLGKNKTARRREVHRSLQRRAAAARRPWLRPEVIWAGVNLTVFTVFAAIMALGAENRPRYHEGQVLPRPVVARAEFQARDEEETRKRKAAASTNVPTVYQLDDGFFQKVRQRLEALVHLGAADAPLLTDEARKRFHLENDDQAQLALSELRRFNAAPKSEDWVRLSSQFVKDLQNLIVLPTKEARSERQERGPDRRAGRITVRRPTQEDAQLYPNEFYSADDDQEQIRERVAAAARPFPVAVRPSVIATVLGEPEAFYGPDPDETARRQQAAAAREPAVQKLFPAGQVFVPADRPLTVFDLQALRQEQLAFAASTPRPDRWKRPAGVAGLIALIGLGLWAYVWSYNPRIIANPTRGMALVGLLLLAQAAAVALTSFAPDWAIAAVAFPTILAAIVLAIAYDKRLAMAAGALQSVLVTLSLGLSIPFAIMLLTGTLVAAAQVDQVRTRSTLLWVGLWTGLAMGAAALWAGLIDRPLGDYQWHAIRLDALLAAATGVVAGFFVQGALPLIEKAFKVTTALSLKDLTDASHPLLRRLAQEAPGTYQHSLRLADIAEAAADAIGANALQCKVGALYHDIGKINKPLYFIENQADGQNRHNKLSPAMSLLIIVGHVKDGLEMAREYGLPPVLRHFIESHHGTTLVEFFYHAARKQSDAQHAPAPSEFEFRYPGPKPRTREAAILMLADSLESAARTLDEHSLGRVEQLVHTIASKRLADGQFHECSLTLQELHKIEDSMTKTLTAMYHGRIKYPTDRGVPSASPPTPTVVAS